MNVVFNPANDDWLAIQVGQDAAQVSMQFFPQRMVSQKRTAIFGGKYGVNQNLRKGLWHGCRMRKPGAQFNSFRVDDAIVMSTQGSSFLATLG